jgi:hypothetical protein
MRKSVAYCNYDYCICALLRDNISFLSFPWKLQDTDKLVAGSLMQHLIGGDKQCPEVLSRDVNLRVSILAP